MAVTGRYCADVVLEGVGGGERGAAKAPPTQQGHTGAPVAWRAHIDSGLMTASSKMGAEVEGRFHIGEEGGDASTKMGDSVGGRSHMDGVGRGFSAKRRVRRNQEGAIVR